MESTKWMVPEPLPRRKSLSSASSSSDEVQDVMVNRPIPVPRPRLNIMNNVSMLRTPSSFLPRREQTDYHVSRSASLDETQVGPRAPVLKNLNGNSDDLIRADPIPEASNPHGEGESVHHVSNGKMNGNSRMSSEKENGNGHGETVDGCMISTPSPASIVSNDSSPKNHRMSVADRLKMFQDKNDESQKKKAPSKPDRKFPPPKKEIVIVEKKVVSTPKKEPPPVTKIEIAKAEVKTKKEEVVNVKPKGVSKRIETVFGQVSKFRNFKASPQHRRTHIENLRNLSTTCPRDSELIQGNTERVAVPLNTPGGKIAVFELGKPGRQADGVIPALVHGTKVMDFGWDPFDSTRLAVGSDDGKLWFWRIPSNGLQEQTNKPELTIGAHAEKIHILRFHPVAKNVLATASHDLTIRIWDLTVQVDRIKIPIRSEQAQVYAMAWSPCGTKIVTGARDGILRIYEPRESTSPAIEGKGPPGGRGGRLAWVLDGKFIVAAGFDRSSERQVELYNATDLKKVAFVSLDVSPSVLIPFYDEDSSILFLSGRGDSSILAFDVTEEGPWLRQLNCHRCTGPHQGLAYLPKSACKVEAVEFARALRLTETAIEPWSFTVPRVKSEYFQDDLFPPTRVTWEPTMESKEWFSGSNTQPPRRSLKPKGMKSLYSN